MNRIFIFLLMASACISFSSCKKSGDRKKYAASLVKGIGAFQKGDYDSAISAFKDAQANAADSGLAAKWIHAGELGQQMISLLKTRDTLTSSLTRYEMQWLQLDSTEAWVCASGDCANGKGIDLAKDGIYRGAHKDSVRDGYGELYFLAADQPGLWWGEWREGWPEGMAVFFFSGDDWQGYSGNYHQGQRNGHGVCYYSDHAIYEGEWKDGVENGRGIFYESTGDIYEGEWNNGYLEGNVVHYDHAGGVSNEKWVLGKKK